MNDFNLSADIVQIEISELSPNSKDFKLVGVIISKRSARSFTDRKNETRSVWNFTLRDSPLYFINVAAWGSEEYIDKLFTTFNVGDIVELINPRVSLRKAQEDTKYQPFPTSSFDLTLSEGKSEINYYSGSDIGRYVRCYHLPTKHPESYVKLQDIVYYTQHNQERRDINLLVAVKYIGLTRTIRTKRGDTTATREIDLMDDTHSGFPLFMWGVEVVVEVVGMADKWTPRETVLFMSDVNLSYNEYRKCWCLSTSSKTIITENPETTSGRALKEFAKSAPLDAKSVMMQLINTLTQISTILSCKSIMDKCSQSCADNFSALVYAVITEYDLDGPKKLVFSKCNHCAIILDEAVGVCTNALCPGMTSGVYQSSNMAAFNIRLSLSDHTEKFNTLPIDVLTQIKWKHLLKRVAAKIIVLPDMKLRTPMISVVSIQLVTLADYSSKVPPF
ncbi:hypothetical protein M8J76_010820 [Diaphorina citri]|nr:hypothetical protein M8J76_010820 [Diaphorina citri]